MNTFVSILHKYGRGIIPGCSCQQGKPGPPGEPGNPGLNGKILKKNIVVVIDQINTYAFECSKNHRKSKNL